MEERHY